MDGGAKIAAANKGTVTFSGYATNQRESHIMLDFEKVGHEGFQIICRQLIPLFRW